MVHGVPETIVRVRVPAKINLALGVGPVGDDGFHPLATVFHAISLYDEIIAEPALPGRFLVETTGVPASADLDGDDHLSVRAAKTLAQAYGDTSLGVALSVRKAIPVAGGMAGGSADAAGALVACAELWNLDVSPDDLAEIGATLGSDVPFGLLGGTAVGTGRGERLAPALTRGSYHWVIAFAWGGLSTPEVYARFDRLAADQDIVHPEVPPDVLTALAAGDARALGAALSNDLQAAALDLRPELRATLEAGLELGAVGAVVSGSGPTCAFLAADESAAIDLSTALPQSAACSGVRRVTGPVPGARLVG